MVEIGDFSEIDIEELGVLVEAAEKCQGRLACLVVTALIGDRNITAARKLLESFYNVYIPYRFYAYSTSISK